MSSSQGGSNEDTTDKVSLARPLPVSDDWDEVYAKALRKIQSARRSSNSASRSSHVNVSPTRADGEQVRRVRHSQTKNTDSPTQISSSSDKAAVSVKDGMDTEKVQTDDYDDMLDAIMVDEDVDAKAVRQVRGARRRNNSASDDDGLSQRANDKRRRRVKRSQSKTRNIPTQVASSRDTKVAYANDGLDTKKEQSPDDVDSILDAILVDEHVPKKESGDMLDEILKSDELVPEKDSGDMLDAILVDKHVPKKESGDMLDEILKSDEHVPEKDSGDMLDELLKSDSSSEEKDAVINPWLAEPEVLEQEETVQLDTPKEGTSVERVNPFTAFVMVNKMAETESPAPQPSSPAPQPSTLALEPQRSMASPARTSPGTAARRYMPPVPPSRPDTSPVASTDRYMPPVSPERPDTGPMAAPDRFLEKPKEQSKAQHENLLATQAPLFDAAVDTMVAAARSVLSNASAEKQMTPDKKAPSPVYQSSVDTSRYGILEAHPSMDAVNDNLEEGGRPWQSAPREAEPLTPKRRALPEFFGERTRSCADVDAYVTNRSPISMERRGPSHVVSPFNDDDDAYILQTAFAQKRVKVVQLLIFGLLGLAFGFLGSFYVQSSCHFLTASVSVGDSSEEFDLHYGMWKYTPLSSVFKGYSYCYKYDSHYTSNTPHYPRIVGLMALLCGVYSLGVLWVYLVLGCTNSGHWNRAIYASTLAGIFQALTMLFFANNVCRQNHCSVGPGAAVSIVSTLTWFFLAFEMHYNTPLSPNHHGGEVEEIPTEDDIVASLEMSDVGRGVKAFFGRMHSRQDLASLHQKYRKTPPGVRGRSPGQRRLTPPNRHSPGRRQQQQQQQQPSPAAQLSYEPPDFVAA